MKKALYSLLAFATLLFAASCAKEPANVADPALGGKPVTTTFTVNMGGDLTKAAPVNSTLDDGTKVNALYVGAYKDGALISTSKVDGSIPVENKKASVSLTLSKGVEYDLVFFAEVAGKYTVNFADGAATFAYPATVNANDPELDAFYKTMKFTPDGKNMTQEVVLTRPFAQLNVLVPNEKLPQDKTTDYVSTMTVKGVPTSFDLLGESPVAPAADASLTFAGAKIDAASFGNYASTAKWVGMNFILVPEAGTVDLTFNETDMPAPLDLTGIAVKTNGRTNLVGNIYGLGDYTFNVTVDEKFADEGETPIDANEVTYVIDDGKTYTAENPLVLDTDAVKSVSVTINGVDGSQITLSEVNANPVETGKQVTVSSSDETVAAVALDGDAIKITPVANGDAVITIETPSFTKATYAAAVAKIYVQVTGMAVEPVDPELTVTGAPAEAVSEAFNLTVTTNSTGEISWTVAPEGAATIAVSEKVGEYIVTPADNLTEDTEVTATFTVAAAEGFNAASKEVIFSVKAAETPVEPEYDFTTIAELKALDMSAATEYSGKLTNAVVTFVPDAKDAFIKDATGSILLYKSDHGMKQGQTFTGDVTVTATKFNELRQITAFDGEFAGEETVVEPVTVTLAQLAADYDTYESEYVKVVDVTSGTTTTVKGNINVTQENTSYIVYTNVAIPVNTGDVFTAEGTVTRYKDTFELKVWSADDLTVSSAADVQTVISGVPTTKNLKPGESYTLAGTTNSGVAVTYAITTDEAGIATLSDGVVTISPNAVAGATVVVTANAAASTGYIAADPVTCTITVIAADATIPDPEEFVFSEMGYGNGVEVSSVSGTNVNILFEKGSNSNAPKYFSTGEAVRTYGGNTFTIDAGDNTMSSIEITFSSGDGTNEITTDVETYSGGTWTGSSSKVVFTIGGTTGHRRIASIKVTYK